LIDTLAERMRSLARPNFGWLTLAAALGLTFIGIEVMRYIPIDFPPNPARNQQCNLLIALFAMSLMLLPHPRVIGVAAYPLFALALGLLIFVLIPFVPESIVKPVNGARSWINLRVMNFQPSEMAKVTFVLSLAWYLRYRANHRTLWGLIPPFLFMLVPVGLIIVEPDLGQSLAFGPALLVVLVAAGAKLRHLLSLLLIAAVIVGGNIAIVLFAPAEYQILEDHQQRRISSMIRLASGDRSQVQTDAYQQDKAMTLVGVGGVGGRGPETSEKFLSLYDLPESHNDMIYSVVVNRWGLVGGLAVMGLYLLLVGSMFAAAAATRDPLGRLSCVGFAGIFLAQAVINIGMNLGVLPITGITLPFVSYGGSSLLFSFIMVGLVMNFASRKRAMMARRSFEFDGRGV
jgi:cell division protein FtsW (lipid II flippase)